MNWYKESKKKKDVEEFSYGSELSDLWINILKMEMDRVNIHFDLENDDGWDIKTKDLKYTDREGQFRVKAKICRAGGDWESPITYFRCQYEEKSYFERDKSWGKWEPKFKTIIIPEKSNLNLTNGEKGKIALDAEKGSKEINDNDLWEEMVEMADKRIKHYWSEYINQEEGGDFSFEKTGCVRKLTGLMKSKRGVK
jgi:hypothetical protein